MRQEYDLKKLRLKRKGPLPGLRGLAAREAKVRITIALDGDVVEHFKSQASKAGALPYQTQINLALREAITEREAAEPRLAERMKAALLEDEDFLAAVASRAGGSRRR